MDDETRKYLRRRRLCFSCQEPWALGHQCTKGKAHYIEVFSKSEDEEENPEIDQGESQGMGEIQEEIQEGVIASLTGVLRYHNPPSWGHHTRT